MSQEKNLTNVFDPKDIQDHKVLSGFGYLIFFLPMLVMKESKFARFHANQILLIWLSEIVVGVAGAILSGVLWTIGLGAIGSLVTLVVWIVIMIIGVLAVMNMIGAFQGKAKRLPVIGKISLISNSNNMDVENMFQNETLDKMADNLQNFSFHAPMVVCPGCGNRVLKGKKFCPKCGEAIPEVQEKGNHAGKKCAQCGCDLEANAKFCPECGQIVPEEKKRSCVKCGTQLKANEKFCPECGTPVKEEKKIENCPKCHAEVKDGMKFCSACGAKVMEES